MAKKIVLQSLEPIAKYKMKLEISRKFGGDGLKIFIYLDKRNESEYEELVKFSKIDKEKLNKIIDFMESIGLVYTEGVVEKVEELKEKKPEEEIKEGYVYKLVSSDSLLRFKHQKIIFKEYSSQGIKVYEIIRKGETDLEKIKKETNLEESKIIEILEFMKNNDIILEKESEKSKRMRREEEQKIKTDEIEEKVRKEEEEKIEKERKKLEEERKKLQEEIEKEEEGRRKLEEKLKKQEEEKNELKKKLEKEKDADKETIEKEIEKKDVEIKKIQEEHTKRKEKEEEFIFKVEDIDEEEFNLFAKELDDEPKIEKKKEKKSKHVKEEEFSFGEEEEDEFSLLDEEKEKKIPKKEKKKKKEEEEGFNFEEENDEIEEEEEIEEKPEIKEEEEDIFTLEDDKIEEPPEEKEEEQIKKEEELPAETEGEEEKEMEEEEGPIIEEEEGEEEEKFKLEDEEEKEEELPAEIEEKEIEGEEPIIDDEEGKEETFELNEENEIPESEDTKEEEEKEEEDIETQNIHYKTKDMQLSEKYKKQKEIFEKFGPEGMKLYSMFTFETTIDNAIEMTKIDKKKGKEIIEYLIYENLIETSEDVSKPIRKIKEKIEEKEDKEKEEEIEEDENYNFTNIKIYEEGEEEEEKEEEQVETKTQVYERKLREEFGEKGVKIYRLIDGRKNAEQIMKEVGVNEDTIIKVFEFMEKEGMIKLEHPGSKNKEDKVQETKMKEETKRKMEPISETSTSSTKKIIIDDIIPIDVPIIKKQSLPDKMGLEAKLLARFGGKALRINTKMNDEKDVVGLAIEMGISLDELDEILYSISNAGGCTFATLSNEDIKKRYGDEAFELYEEFGRDGIMLYELIGKMNMVDIIKFSKIDTRKAAKIIYKTNLLLGIDDIDEETIYKSIRDIK